MFVTGEHQPCLFKNDGLSVCCGKPDTSYLSPPCLLSNTRRIVCARASSQFPMFGFDPIFSCLCVLCHWEYSQWPCQLSGRPALQMQSGKRQIKVKNSARQPEHDVVISACLHAWLVTRTSHQYNGQTVHESHKDKQRRGKKMTAQVRERLRGREKVKN